MGLFDSYNDEASVSGGRQQDQTGTYWQRIDEIREAAMFKTQAPYLKIRKTTLHVVEDPNGSAQGPGTETTEAHFPGKYDFMERDTKRMIRAVLGLTTEETDSLNRAMIAKILVGLTPEQEKAMAEKLSLTKEQVAELAEIENSMLVGRVAEVRCTRVPMKDKPDKFFVRQSYIREVSWDELVGTLGEERLKAFGIVAPDHAEATS